ncbi:unnamed protein product [Microthlaspi erraticum]|uniref:Uncharacterized protein n=1 Tax=Microthlaspi erraticum TaxID=1685480 RepID=A0A6D2LDK9_9BRAS|nr:unnamed protein product [Microthlaspi erraticum]
MLEYGTRFLVPLHSPGGGGLALYWKQGVELSVVSSCDNFIETSITYKGKLSFMHFVYGEPDHTKRKAVWEDLTTRNSARDLPWFLTGDFNDILDHDEKTGGPQRAEGTFVDFRAFISQCDLYDVPHSGEDLSWRGIRYTHLIHSRLDRALSNGLWVESYPYSRCYYLDFEGSDHRPLLTILDPNLKKKKGPFRYDRSLKDNQEITDIVREAWNVSEGSTVKQRISTCRKEISKWNREHHKNSQKLILEEKKRLELAMSSPIPNQEVILEINSNLRSAYQKEEVYWRQRSRILWLTLGDKNSGYFHAITRGRRVVNKLAVIEDKNVAQAIQPCITPEMNETLISDPTPTEIKEALFSISPDKAPGPDGFSACFFQTHCETYIRLIPKVLSPKSVAEYKPIALCNVDYKVISKILTKRLQPILHSIISENQTAFVPGRAISDNGLITHEILHYLKGSGATKYCSMAVKIDMSKAYDRLEWSFIWAVLDRMGFHPKWTNWIFQCISTVSYSFLINGAAQGHVIPQRGIRQGDPLSPFILILCGEVLSGLCTNALVSGTLAGMINLQKSSITFSNKTPEDIRQRVKLALGIEKEGGQGKYLGLPESFGRRKKDLFTLIVDRIRQRSINYSSRFLSNAGKVTMLKSVLASIPTYSMTCFKLPTGLCKRIQSALTRFWWDSQPGKRKMSWIAWEKLTKPKNQGGLGFRELQSFNDALLAKISWRLINNPSCLLSKILLGKYCQYQNFLNVPITSSTSHGWRGILIGRDLLKTNLGRAIGDGKSTSL